MKKKFNFWLNIITICFCVCAIAVGVYSATTAQVTASGKIGFTAHGCKVEIGGNIYGHGVKDGVDDQDGLPVPSNTPVAFTSKTLDGTIANGVTGDFDIGNRYFSDMESTTGAPAPIVITIKVTNKSNYDVEVATNLNNVDKPAQVSIALTTGNATQTIAKDAVATFVFTLTLNPDSTGTTANYSSFDLTNLVIPMTAVKYVEPAGYTVTVKIKALNESDFLAKRENYVYSFLSKHNYSFMKYAYSGILYCQINGSSEQLACNFSTSGYVEYTYNDVKTIQFKNLTSGTSGYTAEITADNEVYSNLSLGNESTEVITITSDTLFTIRCTGAGLNL